MKFDWRVELPQILVVAFLFALAAWAWGLAPDRVPVHWNLHGQVDRMGGKAEGLLIGPCVALGIYLLMLFIPRLDPGRANYAHFLGSWHGLRLMLLAVVAVIQVAVVTALLGHRVDMSRLMPLLLGVMWVVLGSFLGKLRPNWFFGVRTPWTLSSKDSWVKTHRVAGFGFVGVGLVWILSSFLGRAWVFVGCFILLFAMILGVVVYSYLVWKRDPDKSPPAGTLPA